MKQPVYVCGHKNPDSDSIVCTVSYARLKALMGQDVKPIRIGRIIPAAQILLSLFIIVLSHLFVNITFVTEP